MDVNIGEQFQLHQTAAGKAILSVLSDEVVRSIYNGLELKQRTENTIADPDALFEELDTIREQGYALNQKEFHDGVTELAHRSSMRIQTQSERSVSPDR